MKDKFPIILAIILGAFIMYFLYDKILLKKENNKTVIIDNGSIRIDSIEKEYSRLEVKAKYDSTSLSQQKDSVNKVYEKSKNDLNKEREKNKSLAYAVKYYESIKDTSAYYFTCDSLSERTIYLDSVIEINQFKTKDLLTANDALQKSIFDLLNKRNIFYLSMTNEANKQTKVIDSLNAKIKNIASKKYSVTIGPFCGLTPYGFSGGVGIVVGRTFFKF